MLYISADIHSRICCYFMCADIHRICCRVIRELAEENQILKSQVDCLMREVDKLRSQSVLSIMSTMSAAAAMQQQQPISDSIPSRDALLPQHPEPPQLKSAPPQVIFTSVLLSCAQIYSLLFIILCIFGGSYDLSALSCNRFFRIRTAH